MPLKASKPAPLATGTGLGNAMLGSSCNPDNTKTIPQFQADYLAARFRLSVNHARLVASLAWGRA